MMNDSRSYRSCNVLRTHSKKEEGSKISAYDISMNGRKILCSWWQSIRISKCSVMMCESDKCCFSLRTVKNQTIESCRQSLSIWKRIVGWWSVVREEERTFSERVRGRWQKIPRENSETQRGEVQRESEREGWNSRGLQSELWNWLALNENKLKEYKISIIAHSSSYCIILYYTVPQLLPEHTY
jgi:hypothetical protein